MAIRVLKFSDMSEADKAALYKRSEADISDVRAQVKEIIEAVRQDGDAAVNALTKKFDGADLNGQFRVSEAEFKAAYAHVSADVQDAIKFCITSVERHHRDQMKRVEKIWFDEVRPGVFAGEKISPIPSAGLYVPSGKGSFPSVLYMLAIPALVAGVPEIAVFTPPRADGTADPATLVAADLCGIKTVYKIGGAQAIAACAYGTESIPKLSQINGPGNPYVAAAKRLLADEFNPGMPAGPSEALVLADDSADVTNTAYDLLNEAEHGPDSASLLLTADADFATKVKAKAEEILQTVSEGRRAFAEQSLSTYGGILIFDTMDEAIEFANIYAVEHLILKTRDADDVLGKLHHVGEILIGESTPIALGNFGIGINAVLPTGGQARTHDCTSVWTFLKRTSLSYVTDEGFQALQQPCARLAEYETFDTHAKVIRERTLGLDFPFDIKKYVS